MFTLCRSQLSVLAKVARSRRGIVLRRVVSRGGGATGVTTGVTTRVTHGGSGAPGLITGVGGRGVRGGGVRLWLGSESSGLLPLAFPVACVQLLSRLAEFVVGPRLVLLLGHSVLDTIGEALMIKMIKDLRRVADYGSEGVEFDIVLGDFPSLLHFEVIELLDRLSLRVRRSEVGPEFAEELLPVVGPLRIGVVRRIVCEVGFKPPEGGALQVAEGEVDPLDIVDVLVSEGAEV